MQFELKLLYQRPLYPGQNSRKYPLISRLHHSYMCFVCPLVALGTRTPAIVWVPIGLGPIRIGQVRRDPTLQRSRSLFAAMARPRLRSTNLRHFFPTTLSGPLGKTKKCNLERSKNMQRAGPHQPTPELRTRTMTSPFAGHHVSAWSLCANI